MKTTRRIILAACTLVSFFVAWFLQSNKLSYTEKWGDSDTLTSDYTTNSITALCAAIVVLFIFIITEAGTHQINKKRKKEDQSNL